MNWRAEVKGKNCVDDTKYLTAPPKYKTKNTANKNQILFKICFPK